MSKETQSQFTVNLHKGEVDDTVSVEMPKRITDAEREQIQPNVKSVLGSVVKEARRLRAEGAGLQVQNKELEFLAMHDPLTGLLNRRGMQEMLEADLIANKNIAVLFIDLDNFKLVNDTLSHQDGDNLLIAFADYLRANVRKTDTLGRSEKAKEDLDEPQIARFGGDEFVVVVDQEVVAELGEVDNRTPGLNETAHETVEERISSGIPWFISTLKNGETLKKINFGASIGVVKPEASETASDILRRGSENMHATKVRKLDSRRALVSSTE